MARRGLIFATIALVLVTGAAIIYGFATSSGGPAPQASLDDVRNQGVVYLEVDHVFLVYNDGNVLALSDDAQHMDGESTQWCESSQMFETPTHGEKFTDLGHYYGGPAQQGLDRYPVRVEGDAIYVNLDERVPGPKRGSGPAFEPQGEFCVPA